MSYPGYEYPTDAQLSLIEDWDAAKDLVGLLDYIESLWWMPDWGFKRQKNYRKWELHTGGWSGNEQIISALEHNFLFWSLYWELSRAGGHYYFNTRSCADDLQPKVKRARHQPQGNGN